MSHSPFPADFLWGVATSAQQIEGACDAGGRSESIWDRFATLPGRIADHSDARVACDHFHRWREDLERLSWLGVNAYRFSIAWPRVMPGGTGLANPAGLDFYDSLVDGLLAAGIQPFVTLYHWDLPQSLQDRGGWAARATVDAFASYTDAVTRRLGDRVRHWVTHNEPWCIAHLGHERGVHAPGHRNPEESLRVAHHVLLSHARALEVIRSRVPTAQAGIVHILQPVHPASDRDADHDAARRFDGEFNRWYLDPIFRGAYPEDAIADRVRMGHLPSAQLPFVLPGDLEQIARPVDFLGVNYYSRAVVRAGPDGAPEAVPQAAPDALTAMGWEVYPQGLHEILARVHAQYAPPRIYVTENGAAFPDPPPPRGPVSDPRRVEYLRAHVAEAGRAVADGVPLHGYFVWSLMDNFEWAEGYARRFGLFHVDYATLRRTPRDSASWYRGWIAAGAGGEAVPHSLPRRAT